MCIEGVCLMCLKEGTTIEHLLTTTEVENSSCGTVNTKEIEDMFGGKGLENIQQIDLLNFEYIDPKLKMMKGKCGGFYGQRM